METKGALFLDGTFLGYCSGADFGLGETGAEAVDEWPNVVLEDILDAEYIGEE